jgi:hypothetical protein
VASSNVELGAGRRAELRRVSLVARLDLRFQNIA